METFKNAGTPWHKMCAKGKGAFKFKSLLLKNKIIGEKFGDYYVVEDGLNPKDKIVLEGLQKVGSGMEVVPVVTEFESQTNTQ